VVVKLDLPAMLNMTVFERKRIEGLHEGGSLHSRPQGMVITDKVNHPDVSSMHSHSAIHNLYQAGH